VDSELAGILLEVNTILGKEGRGKSKHQERGPIKGIDNIGKDVAKGNKGLGSGTWGISNLQRASGKEKAKEEAYKSGPSDVVSWAFGAKHRDSAKKKG